MWKEIGKALLVSVVIPVAVKVVEQLAKHYIEAVSKEAPIKYPFEV